MNRLLVTTLLLALLLPGIPDRTRAAAQVRFGQRHVERFANGSELVSNTQVWDITSEGGDGCRIFFATNDGLCIYNGVRWECCRPQGSSIIRALRYDSATGRLYSAGVNEFGYWQRDECGRPVYTLLYRNRDVRAHSDDFWRIALESRSGRLFFQCREKICVYEVATGAIRELKPHDSFRFLYETDGSIYVQDGATLCRLGEDLSREPLCDVQSRIINLLSDGQGQLIAAVEHAGLLSIDGNGTLTPLNPEVNARLADAKITCCRRYNDELLLVGTTRRGLFLIANDGSIDHSIEYGQQLDNVTILSAAPDDNGNIWLGLDSGVASIDNSTQDYYFTDMRLGQVHSIVEHDGQLLVGSNKGLFRLNHEGLLQMVPGSTGAVWEVDEIEGEVYVLHDQGLFRLDDDWQLQPVVRGSGVYALRQCRNDRRSYILSTYAGISLMRIGSQGLQFISAIANYNGYARDIRIDERDRIWVTVLGIGFVRLTLSEDKCRVVDIRNYDLANSSDESVLSTRIDQELLLCCSNRAYRIDYATNSLVRSPGAEAILELCGRGVKSILQHDNRFWYVSADGAGYVERSGTSLLRCGGILEQAAKERISTGFRTLNDVGVIGFRNGIGFSTGGIAAASHPVEIDRVAAQGTNTTRYYRLTDPVFEIPAAMNTLCIWPVHLPPPGHQIEYRIASIDPDWKSARIDDCLQIPALPHGRHQIELRAPGDSDPAAVRSVEVRVRPPWYIAWPMILFYVLLVATLLAGVRSYYLRKNRLAQEELHRREKERREKELERLERENLLKEKRISELEREKLKIDLRNKDKRLANITMNSIRRNNMLNELKGEVSELTTAEGAGRVKSIAARIIRQINTQLKDDSDWQLSESYFNTIYDGLLDRLRARYPQLSQTDLRMCVYIKLNLSTKEIAELMNISPRSVEMARYRLRKKLGLGPNDHIGTILQ